MYKSRSLLTKEKDLFHYQLANHIVDTECGTILEQHLPAAEHVQFYLQPISFEQHFDQGEKIQYHPIRLLLKAEFRKMICLTLLKEVTLPWIVI